MRLLVTRPEADAERTATALRACGHTVVVAPLLAHRAGRGCRDRRRTVCGDSRHQRQRGAGDCPASALYGAARTARYSRSAGAARRPCERAGFADVTSADGDVRDLARLVAQRVKGGASLLYLAGADRAGDLAGRLSGQGFVVRTVVIYRAIAAAVLPSAVADALGGGVDGVLHFSRRSAEAFLRAVRDAGAGDDALRKPMHFCISANVAEALVAAGAADIRIAAEPTESALMALVPAPSVATREAP